MHYAPNVPQPRRGLAVPLMAAAVLGAGIATATFAIVNIEDEPIVSLPTPAAEPAAIPSDAVAGQRADGGPEEGAAVQSMRAQPAPSTASSAAAAGTRYDGGPEEGTRGVVVSGAAGSAAAVGIPSPAAAAKMNGEAGSGTASKAAAGVRYDGGPEEGSRAIVIERPDTTISGGPTPASGARP
jgi:hypothetical protein